MSRNVRSLALAVSVVILSSSLPAFAANQSAGETRLRDRETRIVVVVKRLIKRFIGIGSNETPSIPIPVQKP